MPPLSQEFLFVATCSMWPPSNNRNNAIREAAREQLDWDCVLQIVGRHRVAGLIHDGITCARIAVPNKIMMEIDAQAAALVRQNFALVAEAVKLQRIFAEAHLTVAFMKGVSLSKLTYEDVGIRHGRDIDLLVDFRSIMTAITILEDAGYRMHEPSEAFDAPQLRMWLMRCKEFRFVHTRNGLEVELHARLFDNPWLLNKNGWLNSLRTIQITDATGLETFADEDLFVYLCTHGAVHCWFRLKWLADIGAILAQQPEGGIESLYRVAKAKGAGRSAA